MIKELIKLFYNLSKTNKLIRGFKYDKLTNAAGVGSDFYPLCFLEEPIYINNSKVADNTTTLTVNFDIVLLPQALQNFDIKQPTHEGLESIAYEVALSYMGRITNLYNDWLKDEENEYQPFKVVSYNFITLRNWYDDNATGIRCTVILEVKNELNLCLVDELFDDNKELPFDELLPNIDTSDAEGCEDGYIFKLPVFSYGDDL